MLLAWIAVVMIASFAVHPAYARWGDEQAEIRDAIHATIDPKAVVLTNHLATRRFLPDLDMKFLAVDRSQTNPEIARSLVNRYGETYIVFLDRSDSAHWIRDAEFNEAYIRAINPAPELIFDRRFTATDHLRIWRAGSEDGRHELNGALAR